MEPTLEQLDRDPHPLLAQLRDRDPVAFIPALDGWLVTRYDLVLRAMRDPATFTVDDPRFSTAQIIGPSMLSLDGPEHDRHRTPFVAPFRPRAVHERFADSVRIEAERLLDDLEPKGQAELRRAFAGPLATAIITHTLGLERSDVTQIRDWYDAIVSGVTQITAGGSGQGGREAFAALRQRLAPVTNDSAAALSEDEIISNAAVLLFGGIETTEGMIANAILHLLERPEIEQQVRRDPALLDKAIEESLRLEPAAAVVDRYATEDTRLGNADIAKGDLVRLSIAAANRDPEVFEDPDHFDLTRTNARRHLAFAQGPHVCVGVHLARLEARTALARLLTRLPRLRLDPQHPPQITGLVFRKPNQLHVAWAVRDDAR